VTASVTAGPVDRILDRHRGARADARDLRDLTDVGDKHSTVPTEEAEKIFALVSGRRRPEDVRKAYNVLRAMFSRAS